MTPNSEILKEIKIPCVYAYTEPQFENTPWKKRDGKGIIKIGYTQRNVIERIQEQFPIKLPIDDPFSVLAEEVAIREDGSFFNDKDVHKVLERDFGARNAGGEWYEATIDEIRAAIIAVKTRTPAKSGRILAFKMRPEQKRAVEITSKYFSENSYLKTGKTPRFLWNAKMRFGKTFAAYQLAKKMGWKKILVLTFKPAVQSAWQEDLQSHVDFKDWQFVNREGLQFADADKTKPIVWFASFQDVMQKTAVGGIKARNEEIHATNWDCVIFDEYHFGAWRENAKELFINEEIDQSEYNIYKREEVDYFDEEQMPISTNAYLYLSGTPFRAINSGEFLEDQIFSWTYSDEQRAKEFFSSQKQNPYKELPQMVLLTYQMPESIRQAALKGEFNEFDLNEFFKAEKIG
ncbi:MAG: DEAD/DEAH box helicase family protein, partial [Opitutales bacterium]|nr:DEAD/DEAH box helicase family protein [Opitutales bacterium]